MRKGKTGRLPSEPPHDDKKPKDEDDEDDVPQPSTPLTLSHIVHATERASENARRFRKRIVLHVKKKEGCQPSRRYEDVDVNRMCKR
jgi:hypothetical protein